MQNISKDTFEAFCEVIQRKIDRPEGFCPDGCLHCTKSSPDALASRCGIGTTSHTHQLQNKMDSE